MGPRSSDGPWRDGDGAHFRPGHQSEARADRVDAQRRGCRVVPTQSGPAPPRCNPYVKDGVTDRHEEGRGAITGEREIAIIRQGKMAAARYKEEEVEEKREK